MVSVSIDPSLYQRPAELLQHLVRFDTTNPPGDEADCIAFIRDLLEQAGIETTLLAKVPNRPNLVARLPGRGAAPPLLLQGHVDVVTTEGQVWQHPPFAGEIAEGFVWGRGTLDMKGGIAMMLAALIRARVEKRDLPGDVILAVVVDEEALGGNGARFLVDEHPHLFDGVRYAIGEFGGFSLYIGKQRFYPIMIAEKQACWMRATVRGLGGHGSMPVRGGAMARLGRLLRDLDRQRLPVHVTPPARLMFDAIASALGGPTGLILRQLTRPALADRVLGLLGERGRLFDPLLHNTVSPTILHGSDKINVIPGQVSVELDGRLLPGFSPEEMLAELRVIAGDDVEIEVLHHNPGPAEPDMGLFDTLAAILKQADPNGVAVPLLLSGTTDGRLFSQLGIQTYGFLPMQLPPDFSFTGTIHGADERIPVAALDFGADAIYQLLQRFGA